VDEVDEVLREPEAALLLNACLIFLNADRKKQQIINNQSSIHYINGVFLAYKQQKKLYMIKIF
jgi:hypothetical protein